MAAATGGYQFAQQPRAVPNQRPKYRPQNPDRSNIMWDKRVIRGNTYASEIVPESEPSTRPASHNLGPPRFLQRRRGGPASRRRRREANARGELQEENEPYSNVYVELTDPVSEDLATQTMDEDEMERLMPEHEDTIQFIPQPLGEDKETGIEAGELVDFDVSVEPILHVLVGKSLDQGMTEVLQEEQIKVLKRAREIFEQERAGTFTEAQRLENELKRYEEEKKARLAQGSRAVQEREMEEKTQAARSAAKSFYEQLQQTVLDRMEEAGHFHDPVLLEVKDSFVPWLLEKVASELQEVGVYRDMFDKMLLGAVNESQELVVQKRIRDEEERQETGSHTNI